MKNHILLQIYAYSFLRQINKRLCLIPNKHVLFSVNAFASTKSPHRHYIIFYIKNQGGRIGSFLVWWRCGICLTAIVTVGQSRAAEGVHVAKQRHGFCRAKSPLRNKKKNSLRCSFFGGDAGFVANKVCVITKRKCLHFKAECQPGYRGSRCKATARLLPCKIPALTT